MMNLLLGDNMSSLKKLADNSIDSVVTDPPYGLKFMGKKWDHSVPTVEFWSEVYRVLKPGGHILSFGGSRTYHRMAVAIEDAGFEIRDQIMWIYGQGFPKSMNLGNGLGTHLKPAHEPIVLARKPIYEKSIAANVMKWGTGGINIDGCRIGNDTIKTNGGQKFKGVCIFNEYSECKESYHEGRFPANIILDQEAGEIMDEQSVVTVTRPDMNYTPRSDKGGPSRFFYQAKVSSKERNMGLEHFQDEVVDERSFNTFKDGVRVRKDGSVIPELKAKNIHPTVKPVSLMTYLCRLVTPTDGTVLDPFMGSGSTGIAARLEGFNFIGMEMETEYFTIAEARIGSFEKYMEFLK